MLFQHFIKIILRYDIEEDKKRDIQKNPQKIYRKKSKLKKITNPPCHELNFE